MESPGKTPSRRKWWRPVLCLRCGVEFFLVDSTKAGVMSRHVLYLCFDLKFLLFDVLFQLMVNFWFGAWWFGFLGFPYERECYLGVPRFESLPNHRDPDHQFAISWMNKREDIKLPRCVDMFPAAFCSPFAISWFFLWFLEICLATHKKSDLHLEAEGSKLPDIQTQARWRHLLPVVTSYDFWAPKM